MVNSSSGSPWPKQGSNSPGSRRKLALIAFPRCELCGSFDCYKCPVCDKFYCGDCTIRITENTCTHRRYVAPTLERW
jgi:hypothetical protein